MTVREMKNILEFLDDDVTIVMDDVNDFYTLEFSGSVGDRVYFSWSYDYSQLQGEV
jgi:hypothetical protein